jgi:phytoene synthase
MISSELDAAGVREPSLREAYRQCREVNAQHGKTFFLATRLLAPRQRPAVHALYGFARGADDILDDFDSARSVERRGEQLQRLSDRLFQSLVENRPCHEDPTLTAVVHTAREYDISWDLFDDFLASMRMDLTVTEYPDRAALERYMYGSAEVIGLQMLPVLGTVVPREEAAPYAAALGTAFQLTNFLRDVDEDLSRGRVYLPADELAAHGVDRDLLMWCQARRRTDERVRAALAEQHARTSEVSQKSKPLIGMLSPASRPCFSAASTLYSEILDRIEATDFEIFGTRVTVGKPRRIAVGVKGIGKAWACRLRYGTV